MSMILNLLLINISSYINQSVLSMDCMDVLCNDDMIRNTNYIFRDYKRKYKYWICTLFKYFTSS